MSMPAGWYDDGSGRQRWWDGARWTDHVSPDQAGQVVAPQHYPQNLSAPAVTSPVASVSAPRVTPVMGFIGLGLAALGTILACIPVTFIFGVITVIAGFVVSLIGLFTKRAAKWPSIVGMVLSVAGGVIGTVVTLALVAASLAGATDRAAQTEKPSTVTEEPSATPDPEASNELTGSRPSAEEVAVGMETLAREGGITGYDEDFYLCMAEYFLASDLSNEALRATAAADDITNNERDKAIALTTEAGLACDEN